MAEERTQMRLAAIRASDMVGYSHLMGTDEAGTFARFTPLPYRDHLGTIRLNRLKSKKLNSGPAPHRPDPLSMDFGSRRR